MTYQELLNQLSQLTPEQLQQDVTVCTPVDEDEEGEAEYDEVHPVTRTHVSLFNDILDEDHFVLMIKTEELDALYIERGTNQ